MAPRKDKGVREILPITIQIPLTLMFATNSGNIQMSNKLVSFEAITPDF